MAERTSVVLIIAAGIALSIWIRPNHAQSTTPRPCTTNGRIAAVAGTCSNQYYLCYNPNPNGSGNYTQWTYTCPGTSVFNEALQKCSTACPATVAPATVAPATVAPTTAATTTAAATTATSSSTASPTAATTDASSTTASPVPTAG